MKLESAWIVRDPCELSELVDVVWEQELGQKLADYIVGSGPGVWAREHSAMFTEKDEAISEALRRLTKRSPEREGFFNHQAYVEFGYGRAS